MLPSLRTSTRSRWSPKSVDRNQRAPSLLVDEALRASSCSSTSATSPRSCSVRSENHVSKCTPTRAEVVLQALHDEAVAPLARVVGRDVVAELGVQLRGHVDEVLALVAVLGRLLAAVARVERVAELVELRARVVQVVLAVHLGALRGEQVRDRVADRDPAPAAGVQRAGRVGRDELEVDRAGRRAPSSGRSRSPAVDDVTHDVVQPRGREEEVEEAGARDLDLGEMREPASASSASLIRSAISRGGAPTAAFELQGDVRRPVAVLAAAGRVERDAAGRFGRARRARARGRAPCGGRLESWRRDHGGRHDIRSG